MGGQSFVKSGTLRGVRLGMQKWRQLNHYLLWYRFPRLHVVMPAQVPRWIPSNSIHFSPLKRNYLSPFVFIYNWLWGLLFLFVVAMKDTMLPSQLLSFKDKELLLIFFVRVFKYFAAKSELNLGTFMDLLVSSP